MTTSSTLRKAGNPVTTTIPASQNPVIEGNFGLARRLPPGTDLRTLRRRLVLLSEGSA
jgi:hypothetical protein